MISQPRLACWGLRDRFSNLSGTGPHRTNGSYSGSFPKTYHCEYWVGVTPSAVTRNYYKLSAGDFESHDCHGLGAAKSATLNLFASSWRSVPLHSLTCPLTASQCALGQARASCGVALVAKGFWYRFILLKDFSTLLLDLSRSWPSTPAYRFIYT